jgi:hypothetical protein
MKLQAVRTFIDAALLGSAEAITGTTEDSFSHAIRRRNINETITFPSSSGIGLGVSAYGESGFGLGCNRQLYARG